MSATKSFYDVPLGSWEAIPAPLGAKSIVCFISYGPAKIWTEVHIYSLGRRPGAIEDGLARSKGKW